MQYNHKRWIIIWKTFIIKKINCFQCRKSLRNFPRKKLNEKYAFGKKRIILKCFRNYHEFCITFYSILFSTFHWMKMKMTRVGRWDKYWKCRVDSYILAHILWVIISIIIFFCCSLFEYYVDYIEMEYEWAGLWIFLSVFSSEFILFLTMIFRKDESGWILWIFLNNEAFSKMGYLQPLFVGDESEEFWGIHSLFNIIWYG